MTQRDTHAEFGRHYLHKTLPGHLFISAKPILSFFSTDHLRALLSFLHLILDYKPALEV